MPVYTYKDKYWFKNGKCHRNCDLPAIEWNNGSKWWYKNGKCHREGELPAVKYSNGNKYWYINGKQYFLNKQLMNIDSIIKIKIKIMKTSGKWWYTFIQN